MKQIGDITVGGLSPLECLESTYRRFEERHGPVRCIRMNRHTYAKLENDSAPLIATDGHVLSDFTIENDEVVLWGSAIVQIDNSLPENKYWLYDV